LILARKIRKTKRWTRRKKKCTKKCIRRNRKCITIKRRWRNP